MRGVGLGEPQPPLGFPIVAARERIETEHLVGHGRRFAARDGVSGVAHLDVVRPGRPQDRRVHRGQAQQALERDQPRARGVLRPEECGVHRVLGEEGSARRLAPLRRQEPAHEVARFEPLERLRHLRQADELEHVRALGPHHARREPIGVVVVERRRAGHHGAQGGSVRQEGGSELRRVVEARLAKALRHDGVVPLGGEARGTDGPRSSVRTHQDPLEAVAAPERAVLEDGAEPADDRAHLGRRSSGRPAAST